MFLSRLDRLGVYSIRRFTVCLTDRLEDFAPFGEPVPQMPRTVRGKTVLLLACRILQVQRLERNPQFNQLIDIETAPLRTNPSPDCRIQSPFRFRRLMPLAMNGTGRFQQFLRELHTRVSGQGLIGTSTSGRLREELQVA